MSRGASTLKPNFMGIGPGASNPEIAKINLVTLCTFPYLSLPFSFLLSSPTAKMFGHIDQCIK